MKGKLMDVVVICDGSIWHDGKARVAGEVIEGLPEADGLRLLKAGLVAEGVDEVPEEVEG